MISCHLVLSCMHYSVCSKFTLLGIIYLNFSFIMLHKQHDYLAKTNITILICLEKVSACEPLLLFIFVCVIYRKKHYAMCVKKWAMHSLPLVIKPLPLRQIHYFITYEHFTECKKLPSIDLAHQRARENCPGPNHQDRAGHSGAAAPHSQVAAPDSRARITTSRLFSGHPRVSTWCLWVLADAPQCSKCF